MSTGYYRLVTIDPTWLFLSLITSGIGFVLFVYGKKQQRWPQLVAGLAFSVYPYFTPSVGALVGVGFVLGGLLWAAIRMEW
jgi:4-hydroxybenzoate polyprenyltransferase